MIIDTDVVSKDLEPELALVGAIFRKARSDYMLGCRKIMDHGGLEYITERYENAKRISVKYDKEVSIAKKKNKEIERYNSFPHVKIKKDLVPMPKYTKEVANSKGYINRYISITKEYKEVELFLNSNWCETLARMSNLDLDYIKDQFYKVKEEIFSKK